MFTKALTLIWLCSLAVPLAAAAKGSTGEPLLIRNVSAKGSMVQFDVSNVSAKDVRAYVVACRLTGTDGKAGGGVMSLTAVAGLTPLPSVPRSIVAGATFHGYIGGVPRNSRGVYGSCRPTVDYVLFTDGSSWGPDTLKDSLEGPRHNRGL